MTQKLKEYWRVAFTITPLYCDPITYTCTISEPVEEFVKRNKEIKINLIMACMCSKESYNLFKQFNPDKNSYAKLRKEDYEK